MFPTAALLLAGVLGLVAGASAQQCYCKSRGQLFPCDLPVPCGPPGPSGFVSCCVAGDTCGSDLFCHFQHSQAGTSGYYLASCSDPTYSDSSSCPQACTEHQTQDVVFNPATNLWACCYDGDSSSPDCSRPGNVTFQADTPKNLFSAPYSVLTAVPTPTSAQQSRTTSSTSTISSSSPNTSSSSNSSPTSTSSSAASTKPDLLGGTVTTSVSGSPSSAAGSTSAANSNAGVTQSSPTETAVPAQSSSGLSTGAKAGIGAGVAILVVALVASGLFFFWFKRRGQRSYEPAHMSNSSGMKYQYWQDAHQANAYPTGVAGHVQQDMKENYVSRSELAAPAANHPAPNRSAPSELSS